jgi:hypothetical protein
MSTFNIYLKLGFKHITDLNGYDHILFVVALCAVYLLADWRKIAILVTAFTIGHSITLALATLHILKINTNFVEFLIPVTIVITALYNVFFTDSSKKINKANFSIIKYTLAAIFGLIHGLGFSNYLRSLLGNESSLLQPLFAFNLGLELGQLVIVIVVLFVASILVKLFKINFRDWRNVISSIVAGMAMVLMLQSQFFIEYINK